MNKTEIKAVLKADLTPRYERARDSRIAYTISLLDKVNAMSNELKAIRNEDGSGYGWNSKELEAKYEELHDRLYGKWVTSEHRYSAGRYEGGLKQQMTKREEDIIWGKRLDAKQITKMFTAEYKETLTNLVQAIADEIARLKPKNVESGYTTEHDIHFILTMKDGTRRSYTINTIVAGGYIQVIHNRTLRKLHKGIAK